MKTTMNERIRMLRTHLNLTQQDFAELIGITSTQLSRIETGATGLKNKTIVGILSNTTTDKSWLIDGIGDLNAQIKINDKLIANESVNTPWKDEAYQLLKDEVKDLRDKHSKAMEMLSRMIDRMSLGKHKAFDFTANVPKNGKFVSKAA